MFNPDYLRQTAERSRSSAEPAAALAEYPRLTKSAHLEIAETAEKLADKVEAIAAHPPGSRDFEARRARRVALLEFRAARAAHESAQAFLGSVKLSNCVPFGQPILIGHHSERRHRGLLRRVNSGHERSAALHKQAADLRARAFAARNNDAIYSQDENARAKINAKIAALESSRDRLKALNAEYRKAKGDLAKMALTDSQRAELASDRARYFMGADRWKPAESYQLTNLGAEIRRLQTRLASLDKREQRQNAEHAERRIGAVRIIYNAEFDKIEVHFPGKPAPAIISTLKSSGFRWIRSAGCWARSADNATQWRLEQLARELGAPLETIADSPSDPADAYADLGA